VIESITAMTRRTFLIRDMLVNKKDSFKEKFSIWESLPERSGFYSFAFHGSMIVLLGGIFTGTIGLYGVYILAIVISAQLIDFIRLKYLKKCSIKNKSSQTILAMVLSGIIKIHFFGMAFFTVIGFIVMTYNAFEFFESSNYFKFILTYWNRGTPA
tara:strand:- start:30 stop:497 length:468 start_codon:yes stop_codon:yes gene_type:complete